MKTEIKRTAISAEGSSFALIVSRWHDGYTSQLESGAKKALLDAGAATDDIDVFHVPGSFELPVACRAAAESGMYSAIIALGVIIRGDTPHFDYVSEQTAAGIMQASVLTGVPVMFGVITADNEDQVVARSGSDGDNKGTEAALSAIEMISALSEISAKTEERFEDFKQGHFNVV